MPDLLIRQGDTLPALDQSITDSTGKVLDLTGCTVEFVMRAATAIAPTVSAAASITDASLGLVSYAWGPDDTASAGIYAGIFRVTTTSSGATYTYPNDGYLEISIEQNLSSSGGQTIVTLGEARDHINIKTTDKADDAKLLRFINGATPVVESICGPILVTQYDEWHSGGQTFIMVNRRPSNTYGTTPVFEVQAISEYSGPIEWPLALITSPDQGQTYSAMVDPSVMGKIVRRSAGGGVQGFPIGPETVHVVYTAGQSCVPENVRQGTLELVRIRFQRTQRGRPRAGGGTYVADDNQPGSEIMGFYVPNEVREMMVPNRRFPALA